MILEDTEDERYRYTPNAFYPAECKECAVVVTDTDVHDNFHVILDRIAKMAQHGDSAWGMTRPIGGW